MLLETEHLGHLRSSPEICSANKTEGACLSWLWLHHLSGKKLKEIQSSGSYLVPVFQLTAISQLSLRIVFLNDCDLFRKVEHEA